MSRKTTKKKAPAPTPLMAKAKDPLTQSFIPETSDINKAGLIAEFNRLLKTARTLQGEAKHWAKVAESQAVEINRQRDIVEAEAKRTHELRRVNAWQEDVINHQEITIEKYSGPQYSALFIGIMAGIFIGFVITSRVM